MSETSPVKYTSLGSGGSERLRGADDQLMEGNGLSCTPAYPEVGIISKAIKTKYFNTTITKGTTRFPEMVLLCFWGYSRHISLAIIGYTAFLVFSTWNSRIEFSASSNVLNLTGLLMG